MSPTDENFLSSITHVRICHLCLRLYEAEYPSGLPQLCACQAAGNRWPRNDLNERVHLCECCRTEVVPSGSKWSSFLCDACKVKAVAVNERAGHVLVPFGRHTLMARQRIGFLEIVATVDEIFAFGKETLEADLDVLGFPEGEDVDLTAFLEAARASEQEEDESGYGGDWWGSDYRFRCLCYRLLEAAGRILGPSGPEVWRPYLEHLPIELGLVRCDVCGEYRGPAARCICQGALCISCKLRMARRPISEYYDEATGRFIHVGHFVPPLCEECRKNSSAFRRQDG